MHKPYISPDQKLPELTLKAVLLGATLSVVLSAANAYFGLFAGLTVSASIPAAVISMAILKFFKNSNILENNLVQTAASAGESLAAGVIFTIPALVIMGYWQEFNYWETVLMSMCGGILGVMFTVPLRQALIVKENLKFPEGVATAEVLKTGNEGGKSVKYLIWGAAIGALFKVGDAALNLWHGIFERATVMYQKVYVFFGVNLSPALVAVGYIVGLNISFLVFLGGAISWFVAIPIIVGIEGMPEGADAVGHGYAIWSSKIRYLGVGSMVVGGIWALISLKSSLAVAFSSGIKAFREGGKQVSNKIRTDIDTPMSWVLIGIGVMVVPIFLIYYSVLSSTPITLVMTVIMIVAGFLFAAVAGYMAGLVGSSNNPISGVTIATILFASLLLLVLIGTNDQLAGSAAAIMIGAVVCCAAAIAGDNMQDLKAGHVLGATPAKQQIMQMVGVIAGALAIPFVLNLLLVSNGIGPATAEQPNALAAPQSTLMMSVATGIFGGNLPWGMVYIGAGIGVLIIATDLYLKRRGSNFRMPVLAVAVGLYLPFELDSAIFVGGILAWLIDRSTKQSTMSLKEKASNAGLLLASGLITGEALMGILIAGVTVWAMKSGIDPTSWRVFQESSSVPGLLLFLGILAFMYFTVKKVGRKPE